MDISVNQKQRCLNIIERFPKEQLAMLADSLENMYKMIEEAVDMAFCVGLSENHRRNNPVHKEEDFIPMADAAKRLGVNLNDM